MIDLYIFIALLVLGYAFGILAEKRHYKSIIQREEQLRQVRVLTLKRTPQDLNIQRSELVVGNIVVSVDYFKRFVASLRNLVGGRVSSYESLLDRGRREAILRMQENAQSQGAKMILNVKLETASISKGKGNAIGSVEVYAYGTALILNES